MRETYSRRAVLKATGLGGITAIGGCVGKSTAETGETIDIGFVMSLTGDLGGVGKPIRDGALLAVKQINDADTEVSVDTMVGDAGTSPDQGVDAAINIVNEGYPMICGALSSGVSMAVTESVGIPYEIPMCSPASTSPAFTPLEDGDYFFRTVPTDGIQGTVLAGVVAEKGGASSVSVLFIDDSYGNALADQFVKSFQENHGGTVHEQIAFTDARELGGQEYKKLLSEDPEGLVLIAFPESGADILSDLYTGHNAGSLDIFVPDGLRDESLPGKVKGGDLTNVIGTSPAVGGPGLEFFQKRYKNVYDREPGIFNEHAYDAAAALLLAQASADKPTGPAIRDQIRPVTDSGGETITPQKLPDGIEMATNGTDVHYKGVSGPVGFDQNGDIKGAVYDVFRYTSDGTIKVTGQRES